MSAGAATPTILVVEDNPITRKMLRVALESEGYTVVEAADGRAAIAEADRCRPALVLQDLILPDMNGFELVRQLRALPATCDTPIFALSGFLGRIEEARTAQAGFTAVLVKPIEPSRLLEAIQAHVKIDRDTAPRVGEGHRILLVDDDPIQLKLTRIYFEQIGFEVAVASSAGAALRSARIDRPDVIVSDVLMPDVDGFQLCLEVRRDPRLARVPVVLLSAWYQTEADRDLARRVGANALMMRSHDLKKVGAVVSEHLGAGAPTLADEPSVQVRLEHAQVVIHQLERQRVSSSALARRCTLQAAQIALLSGVADALARKADTSIAVRDVLTATLDATGISKGALYLRDGGGQLSLRHTVGFSEREAHLLADFFGQPGHLEAIIDRQAAVSIPSPAFPEDLAQAILEAAAVPVAQVVPLISEGRGAGAIVLAAKRTDVTSEDSVAFARAMGNMLVQSVELEASFARLAASEQRYRTLTENAYDAIAILSADGVIREVNRRLEEMLGVSKDQIIGRRISDFATAAGDGQGGGQHGVQGGGTGRGSPRVPALELSRPDGSTVLVEFSDATVEVGGERMGFAIGRDVTEQARAQAQLMVSDRMASIGAMAAGVAHEINNPLAAVTANLDLAVEEIEALAERLGGAADLSELTDEVRDARTAAEQVRSIVRDLKIFSRAEEERRGPVDIQQVLESSLRMAWNEIRHRARVVKDYGQTPAVLANESRLGQVFLNLIVNAAQAIPEGHANTNEIRIRTRLGRARTGSERVVIDLSDTGSGIPPAIRHKVFDPFFTTKPAGVGTGLGLAICHRIITGMGGEITVASEVGKGTTFSIVLPIADVEESTARQSLARPAPSSRRGRILVVDDEKVVASAVRRVLSHEHEVQVLTSAQEALRRIGEGERFDLILCDLMMPIMTGVELHNELCRTAPDQAARMVFLTAGAFTPRARAFLDEVPNPRLDKPFELATLRALVLERLG
ncbi:MAG TPA: response regulator [Kofleriaceae bacterium]|nr:response regulator [Kofleriaceae bacterium]